jgi:ribonuclease H / adenosylcobalamin/alpha-ribazole phosphatase
MGGPPLDPVLVLMRHAATGGNEAGILMGSRDDCLSAQGRVQAEALGQWLKGRFQSPALWSSPAARARETAELLASSAELNLHPDVLPQLRERDLGEFEGLPASVMLKRRSRLGPVPADATVIWDGVQGVEQDVEVADRALVAVREGMTAAPAASAYLFVTHAGVIKSVLHQVLGVSSERAHAFRVGLGSAFVLGSTMGYWELREIWQNPYAVRRYTD